MAQILFQPGISEAPCPNFLELDKVLTNIPTLVMGIQEA
jgi:hypothetical protein